MLLPLLLLPACHTERTMVEVTPWVALGDYGRARHYVAANLENNRRQREYLLDRMMLGVTTLDDGYAESAGTVFESVYEVLRTQGINADKTVASVVLNEDVKFWKGEPFEQALTFAYCGLQQASVGQWDNARAAASNSLFNLRDFSGEKKNGERIDTLAIARQALEYEREQAGKSVPPEQRDYFNSGYAVKDSNFTLGYILHGLASQQLGRAQEAGDYFAVAANIDPSLRPMLDRLIAGDYNTVLIVAWGLGPHKAAYGPDNALARFVPRFPSDDAKLVVRSPQGLARYPLVTDVNRMAADHMWNNLEDVRQAKSVVGTGLLAAGGITTAIGADRRSNEAVIAGLALMAAGAVAKAGAHADTRYCPVMPQRFYVVPLTITQANTTVELEVEGRQQSRMVLAGLSPPPPGETGQLRYVRLVSGYPTAPTAYPPQWAVSGRIFYGNAHTGPASDRPRPYVLGGDDMRPPSVAVLQSYAHDPQLRTLTPAELENLYRAEGITWTIEDTFGYASAHVLEGGRSLVAPLPGTAGFARLFGRQHPPYRTQSVETQRVAGAATR